MHFIEKIRAEHPAPFYIYDGKIISEQASILHETFPGFRFLFSVKANPFLPVLKKMASLGIGADAASAKEVDLALEAGMPAENISLMSWANVTSSLTASMSSLFWRKQPLNAV